MTDRFKSSISESDVCVQEFYFPAIQWFESLFRYFQQIVNGFIFRVSIIPIQRLLVHDPLNVTFQGKLKHTVHVLRSNVKSAVI